MKQSPDKLNPLNPGKKILNFSLILILGGAVSCSVGTDKSTPLPEKPLSELKLSSEGSSFKSENRVPSAEAVLAERSQGAEADGHPQVNDQVVPREIIVPSDVKGRWKAVRILFRNKKDPESGKMQIADLGTSFIPQDSGLKVTVGPFLPNFVMNKTSDTSKGNDELNPAVQLIVEENGKIIYKGWAFKKFPTMYAFEHDNYSLELMGAVPAVVS
jgi:hypothetical protein